MKNTHSFKKEASRDGSLKVNLQPLEGRQMTFYATFEGYGVYRKNNGILGFSILLLTLKDNNGRILTNHIWINNISGFKDIEGLNSGDQIQFTALVKMYRKGYQGLKIETRILKPPRIDYGLENVRNIRKIVS
jgi:hypothetical protein